MDKESWVVEVRENITETMRDASAPVWDTGLGLEQYRRSSIFKVPENFRDLSPTSFSPHVVSFGPYHHGEERLTLMEEQKQRAVARFFNRSKKPLDSLLDSIAKVVPELRDAYYSLDQSWKDDSKNFFQVMITDGCFMAEILLTAKYGFEGYAADDPVFSKHGKLHVMPFIARDMLMLENQLPMLLLRKLFAFLENKSEEEESATIYKLIISFFPKLNFLEEKLEKCQNTRNAFKNSLHVLDVFRKSLLYEPEVGKTEKKHFLHRSLHFLEDCFFKSVCFPKGADSTSLVRSAAELREAGIQFTRSKTRSLKDISFHDGILSLPKIFVDDTTEPTIRNLLAMECLHVGTSNEVSSYVYFMDRLIDTERDVAILILKGIIRNNFGSDKAVAKLFNSLSKDITDDPEGSLHQVEEAVSSYCQKPHHRWRANLTHTYFRSPWSVISLVAAILLFTLAAVQTYCSAYQFFHSKS